LRKGSVDTLTKKEIAEKIIVSTGLTPYQAGKGIETFFEIIKEALARGEDVTLSGFGKWSVKVKQARKSLNPQTGEDMIIPPRRVAAFSLSHVLKAKLVQNK